MPSNSVKTVNKKQTNTKELISDYNITKDNIKEQEKKDNEKNDIKLDMNKQYINIEDNKEDAIKNKTIEIENRYKEKINKINYYSNKKELIVDRIVRIRREYMLKEKTLQIFNIFYYLIFPGNASYLIKNCMNHRSNWKEAFSNVTLFYNFKWTELSSSLDYSSLGVFFNSKQVVNHFVYTPAADPSFDMMHGWSIAWYVFAGFALVVAISFAIIFKYKHVRN